MTLALYLLWLNLDEELVEFCKKCRHIDYYLLLVAQWIVQQIDQILFPVNLRSFINSVIHGQPGRRRRRRSSRQVTETDRLDKVERRKCVICFALSSSSSSSAAADSVRVSEQEKPRKPPQATTTTFSTSSWMALVELAGSYPIAFQQVPLNPDGSRDDGDDDDARRWRLRPATATAIIIITRSGARPGGSDIFAALTFGAMADSWLNFILLYKLLMFLLSSRANEYCSTAAATTDREKEIGRPIQVG